MRWKRLKRKRRTGTLKRQKKPKLGGEGGGRSSIEKEEVQGKKRVMHFSNKKELKVLKKGRKDQNY